MPVPVISVTQMREWEQATWAQGQTENEVIKMVGSAIARRVLKLTHLGDTILILAGKGHNGDDARAAQPHLTHRETIVLEVSDPRAATEALVDLLKTREKSRRRIWVIDALFGIGLNRPLNEQWIELIETVNRTGLPVLAVDVPSGLNADTGETEGAAIQAAVTLTIGAPKQGLLASRARPFAGKLEVAHNVGLIPCPIEGELRWSLAEDFESYPPRRKVESNKGTYGHLLIYAGSLGYHGAALLASHGALRAQPGLVTLYTQDSVYVPVASQLQCAMVRPWKPGLPFPKTTTAILIGPGLAAPDITLDFKNEVRALWQDSPLPIVVDASALDWLRPGGVRNDAIRVLTPHPGEAARLLNIPTEKVQADRAGKLRDVSRQFGNCHVILKGHQTLVGRSTGDIFVNGTGNPLLAQGGSGDLLAGYLAGLLAQPMLQSIPMQALRYAVWQHGAAADHLSETRRNWTPDDLAEQLGTVEIP